MAVLRFMNNPSNELSKKGPKPCVCHSSDGGCGCHRSRVENDEATREESRETTRMNRRP